jgi:hypothetical protein
LRKKAIALLARAIAFFLLVGNARLLPLSHLGLKPSALPNVPESHPQKRKKHKKRFGIETKNIYRTMEENGINYRIRYVSIKK